MVAFLPITLLVVLVPIGIAIITHKVMLKNDEELRIVLGNGQMFDNIAHRYDLVNKILAFGMDRYWRQQMVNVIQHHIQNEPEPLLLDVATGTADVAIRLYDNIHRGYIVGVDPSKYMLEIGKQKIHQKNYTEKQISLQYGEAMNLVLMLKDQFPYHKDSTNIFHAATISFGIRNVFDYKRALCEMNKVIKIGGLLCILEFSEPDSSKMNVMGWLAKQFIHHVVPVVGGIITGKPKAYQYLQKSIHDFPSPKQFVKEIELLHCTANDPMETSVVATSFEVVNVKHMNFGSVQLFTLKKIVI